MNSYLLDTHIFLWWISYANRLSKEVFDIISDSSNQIYISSASIWEIVIKESLGKIEIDANLDTIIEECGFLELKRTFSKNRHENILIKYCNRYFI